ncbi:MAG: YbaN family protein [Eubacteriales bacterium]
MKTNLTIKKVFFIFLGTLSLVIGVIGIFVPLLPTTPLLLLSAYCYLKSSEKRYNRLMNSNHLGKYIKNYMEHRSVTKKAKYITLIILWVSLTASIIIVNIFYVRLLLLIVGIVVSIHLILLRTLE